MCLYLEIVSVNQMDQDFQLDFIGMAEMHLIVQRYKTDNFHAQDNETIQLLRVWWYLKIVLLLFFLLKDVKAGAVLRDSQWETEKIHSLWLTDELLGTYYLLT